MHWVIGTAADSGRGHATSLLGLTMQNSRRNASSGGGQAAINVLYTQQEYRKRGHATLLIEYASSNIRNGTLLQSGTNPSAAARGLYRMHGFHQAVGGAQVGSSFTIPAETLRVRIQEYWMDKGNRPEEFPMLVDLVEVEDDLEPLEMQNGLQLITPQASKTRRSKRRCSKDDGGTTDELPVISHTVRKELLPHRLVKLGNDAYHHSLKPLGWNWNEIQGLTRVQGMMKNVDVRAFLKGEPRVEGITEISGYEEIGKLLTHFGDNRYYDNEQKQWPLLGKTIHLKALKHVGKSPGQTEITFLQLSALDLEPFKNMPERIIPQPKPKPKKSVATARASKKRGNSKSGPSTKNQAKKRVRTSKSKTSSKATENDVLRRKNPSRGDTKRKMFLLEREEKGGYVAFEICQGDGMNQQGRSFSRTEEDIKKSMYEKKGRALFQDDLIKLGWMYSRRAGSLVSDWLYHHKDTPEENRVEGRNCFRTYRAIYQQYVNDGKTLDRIQARATEGLQLEQETTGNLLFSESTDSEDGELPPEPQDSGNTLSEPADDVNNAARDLDHSSSAQMETLAATAVSTVPENRESNKEMPREVVAHLAAAGIHRPHPVQREQRPASASAAATNNEAAQPPTETSQPTGPCSDAAADSTSSCQAKKVVRHLETLFSKRKHLLSSGQIDQETFENFANSQIEKHSSLFDRGIISEASYRAAEEFITEQVYTSII